jgi:DNA-binding GntR family transcriptional regulator
LLGLATCAPRCGTSSTICSCAWRASTSRILARLVPKMQRLRQHLALEADARRRSDARAVVRLSGEFHQLLAELAGNSALARTMRELSTLTCLIISLYDAPTATSCRADEHEEIVAAVNRGDAARAEKLMLHHLDHIEQSLKLDDSAEEVDLESVFS